jgi:hypothetical protein
MAPHECHQIEKITTMQGELNNLKTMVSDHAHTLYNGGDGVKDKVLIMFNWYKGRVAMEKAIIVGLVLSGFASVGSIALQLYIFMIQHGAVN